ncbi:hypothetical protein FLA_3476 [Filimonas lacunae]|nr:hypothetical protein FLA_3476 [Filimonas lacunae]
MDTATGTLYSAGEDIGNSYKVIVKRLEGTEWKTLGTPWFSVGAAIYINMAISPSGVPHVVYRDGGVFSKLVVKKFNGTNWVLVGKEGFSPANYDNARSRLAFAPDGTLYVAYTDYATGMNGKLSVMKFNGTDWVGVGSPGFTSGAVNANDIAVDPLGRPLVAYGNGTNTNKLSVSRFNGTAWEIVGTDGFTASSALNGAMTLDKSGNPWVVFADATRSNRLTVMKYDGSAWVTVGNAGFTTGILSTHVVYHMCSIIVDNTNNPVVTFADASNGGKVSAMRFNGTDWVLLGDAGFSGGNSNKCVELLRYKNWIYTGFADVTTWQGRIMQYKLCEAPDVPTITADKSKVCLGDAATLRIGSGALNDAAEWSWYTGFCGGTAAGTGASITVMPTVNTTYYVRATGGCADEQSCVPFAVQVADKPETPVITQQTNGLLSSSAINNQWYVNGGAINGANASLYTPAASGNYTVVVTNSDGCSSVSLPFTATVGTNLSNEQVMLLPNPVHDHVKVQFSKIIPQVFINIISLDGKLITTARFNNINAATLDTRALQPGVYLVRVFSDDGSSQILRMIKGN